MEESLSSIAARTDAAVAAARRQLVDAVRRAHAAGMTQSEIAAQIGRSQPEVNRLLRFHGTTPHAKALRAKSSEVRRALAEAGGRRVRVFGSTARGTDRPDSDVDLVFDMDEPLSLMQLSAVEKHLSELIGVAVDLVPASSLRPDLRESVLNEAVLL